TQRGVPPAERSSTTVIVVPGIVTTWLPTNDRPLDIIFNVVARSLLGERNSKIAQPSKSAFNGNGMPLVVCLAEETVNDVARKRLASSNDRSNLGLIALSRLEPSVPVPKSKPFGEKGLSP